MKSSDIGKQYDKIAVWWNDYHYASAYGVDQVQRALNFAGKGGHALDVGCGSGGRLIRLLEKADLRVTGLDASAEMITLAQANHPNHTFIQDDISRWDTDASFDFILAWDCLFHLPLDMQKPVLKKLCRMLAPDGIMIHTFGDEVGSHTDNWRGQKFAYSSIGISENIQTLKECGLSIRHLELDQFPEKHVYAISQKD